MALAQEEDDYVFVVELSLVDLSQELEQDSSGKKLPSRLDAILEAISCDTAQSVISPPPPPKKKKKKTLWFTDTTTPNDDDKQKEEVRARLQKQVTRFLKPQDKYISLTSILLKSQAFWATHPSPANNPHSPSVVVVELPRTDYRKPYIPSPTKYDAFPEVNLYPISISHQFPFVGMARLETTSGLPPQSRPLVGLDIVTFDEYNPRLYNSLQEFIEVFQTSFTPWEWTCIQSANHQDGSMLQEFYLRWAMKEAYTKALGVGMGLSFESFETHLDEMEDQGIYSWLAANNNNNKNAIFLQGTVVLHPNNTPQTTKSERCAFLFAPLWKSAAQQEPVVQPMQSALGCACLCLVHSTLEKEPRPSLQLETKWSSLQDLVDWHESGHVSKDTSSA